mmetsp:Transcript_19864/g.30573  ORF Transcript_19864/g.30573 Transcript_19864/m.30573 type:complete len:84 (-) Transcript_19864:280-531(-)
MRSMRLSSRLKLNTILSAEFADFTRGRTANVNITMSVSEFAWNAPIYFERIVHIPRVPSPAGNDGIRLPNDVYVPRLVRRVAI